MIDLRSDTVTKPTQAMREAMCRAKVGDDVYGDDPTANELEAEAAIRLGKEAALFCPTGTMGNQLAIMAHCRRGEAVIVDAQSHIVLHEVGAAAVLSAVTLNTVPSVNGAMALNDMWAVYWEPGGLHTADPALLCLENAHGCGAVLPLCYMAERYEWAKRRNLAVHLDGARIFNAAAALGCQASEIAVYTDTVMFCLSKGLCAPVGSMLCGPAELIARARKYRKMLGGGMRQVGILAAAGLIALRDMTARLTQDHARARRLAKALDGIPGLAVDTSALDINMVFSRVDCDGLALYHYLQAKKINVNAPDGGVLRLVTHHDVTDRDVDAAAEAIRAFFTTKPPRLP
jgi:threonine aldolase